MNIILTIKEDRYYMTLETKNNRKKCVRYISNQEFIESIIKDLKKINLIIKKNTNYELKFENDINLILKNYAKNQNSYLYKLAMSKMTSETRIESNYVFFNKKRLISLILAGTISLSTVSLSTLVIKNLIDEDKNVEIEDNIDEELIKVQEEIDKQLEEMVNNDLTQLFVPEKEFIIESNIETRFEKTRQIIDGTLQSENIGVATKIDNYSYNKLEEFMSSDTYKYFIKYGADYGVDPYLLIAIGMQESSLSHDSTLPKGDNYNGYAYGIMQHESPWEIRTITAFNYVTEEYETEILNEQTTSDIETNIKLSSMIMQEYIQKYDNNIYLALQAYNYGYGVMDILISKYAKDNNITFKEVVNNYRDTGWLDYVHDMHNNPQKYISNWPDKYGNDKYIEEVLGYYIGTQSRNVLHDGTICYTDLLTLDKHYEELSIDKVF